MKFDNFCKYAGSNGVILVAPNDEKWLFYHNVGMLIPDKKNVCGQVANMPDYITQLVYDLEYEACELTGAYLPDPYAKTSELIRHFTSRDNSVDITNKAFGFIESGDLTYMSHYEDIDTSYTALLVTNDYSDNNAKFKMICIERED